MYIRKKYRRLLDLADNQFTIPSSFQRFVDEKRELHNLIIKSKGGHCLCTCCKHRFVSQERINKVIKCPKCKHKLLLKTDKLKYYLFKDHLQLLDKVEDTFILRTFELISTYDGSKVSYHLTEFMRSIFEDSKAIDFVSDQVKNHMGWMYISHNQPKKEWRGRNHRWSYHRITGMVCPYNLKSLLRDTDLKYSQLDKYVAKQDYMDFIRYFTQIAHYPSFELLVKMKLYNLAEYSSKFYKGKSFQEVFGVSKSFYQFMKKHNITYEQLKVLKLIQKEDIRLINRLVRFNTLEELSRYVNLEEAYYKVLRFNKNEEYEYLDYLRCCVQLQYDMNSKQILYPKKLEEAHDKVTELVEIVENEANNVLIQQRLSELNKNIYQDDKYIIYPASSVEDLIDESSQMSNCVKTYSRRYALSETTIYFMRELANQSKSLVTIEVKGNEIVQAKAKHNTEPNEEELSFLELWESKVLNKATA